MSVPAGRVAAADAAWAACDGHVGVVARQLVDEQGHRPRHTYRLVLRGPDDTPAVDVFTCPVCGAKSAHLVDIAEGYCGRCHDWTWPPRPLPA